MDTNMIYCGDCLEILKKLEDNSIDLIYLDPPFFSRKEYENFWIKDKITKFSFSDKDWEKLRSKINPNVLKQYEDIEKRWKGGHKGIYVYIAYMKERLEQCWRVLKSTGSIYLHCDWHASHYLKQVMDEVFGYDKFRNEIIWLRKTSTGSKKRIANSHDIIFYYTKSDKFIFNQQYMEYDEEYVKKQYRHTDKKGRYRIHDVIANKALTGGGATYTYKDYHSERWLLSKEKIEILDKKDMLVWSKSGKPYRKLYLEEMKGKPLSDVWTDISISLGKENLGYPTQKPEKIMDRILKLSSNEGYIVLDPFCGCGTTLVTAHRLNRNWIGIDISRTACDIIKKRLGGKVKVIGGETEKELRNMTGHEFARLMIVEKLNGTENPKKSGDMGIDGWVEFMTIPVQVKNWGHKVGRPEIDKFAHAIKRVNKKKGMIVAFDFSKECYSEVARIEKEDKVKIELKRVRDIMGLNYYGN